MKGILSLFRNRLVLGHDFHGVFHRSEYLSAQPINIVVETFLIVVFLEAHGIQESRQELVGTRVLVTLNHGFGTQ